MVAAVLSGALALSMTSISLGSALTAKTRLDNAADLSALAAADTLFALSSGDACARAREIAALNGAELTRCDVGIDAVSVTVVTIVLSMRVQSSARAGAPEP